MIYIAYLLLLLIMLSLERHMPNEKNGFRLLIPLVYILFIGPTGEGFWLSEAVPG